MNRIQSKSFKDLPQKELFHCMYVGVFTKIWTYLLVPVETNAGECNYITIQKSTFGPRSIEHVIFGKSRWC